MNSPHKDVYPDDMIGMLETLWGEGFLSPGGPKEVARILEGHSLKGACLLDIGCGSGGVDIALVENHHVAKVTGIDVEEGVLAHARDLVQKRSLNGRIELVKVEPGRLPFPDENFDAVFSKDSIIHIQDKHALMSEAFRVLKPDGHFLASDWLRGTEEQSPAMSEYIAAEGLGFEMASPTRYRDAMDKAGFVDIRIVSRNEWYRNQARTELARLRGPVGRDVAAVFGQKIIDDNIRIWELMIVALDSGELCPSHLFARKP